MRRAPTIPTIPTIPTANQVLSPEERALNQAILESLQRQQLQQVTTNTPNTLLPITIVPQPPRIIVPQPARTVTPVTPIVPRSPVVTPIVPRSPIVTFTPTRIPNIPPLARQVIVPPPPRAILTPVIPRPTTPIVPRPVQPQVQPPVQPVVRRQVPPVIPPPVQPVMNRPIPPVIHRPVQPVIHRPIPPPVQPVMNRPIPPVISPPVQPVIYRRISPPVHYQRVPPLVTPIPSPPRNIRPPYPIYAPGPVVNDDDDAQLRMAIAASLENQFDPIIIDEKIMDEDLELQEALDASVREIEAARLKEAELEQLRINREMREEQDREYQEALRIDIEKAENKRLIAEAAEKAAEQVEEDARLLQEEQALKEARRMSLLPPSLVYPLERSAFNDVYMMRFKLPDGSVINHSFNRNEPLSSVLQQLRFDLKYLGELVLTIQPRTVITCAHDTPIGKCGLGNRIMILVDYP